MENVIRISGIGDPQGFLPDGETLQFIFLLNNYVSSSPRMDHNQPPDRTCTSNS